MDEVNVAVGVAWWEESTDQGSEGMVVKPCDFIVTGRHGLIQPAIKCRGREYLRIIYGPEYTIPQNLERLRSRGLNAKRSLALREFALGIEGLERFILQEPLRRVHECVFGVLALESEPVDPRRTRSAEMADIWLQPRPGTDSALLLGIINVIITEGLYDREFVSLWCYGFEQLTARVAEYPLERMEKITDVPVAQIQAAARLYAANRPGCFVEGLGIEHTQRLVPSLQARWVLAGLSGNIDMAGGEEQCGPHPNILTDEDLEPKISFSPKQIEKQIGAERFPLLSRKTLIEMNKSAMRVWGRKFAPHVAAHAPSVYRAMLTGKPYPVRAMFTFAANPMVTQANTHLVYDAIKSLNLHVVSDFFLTPTAELADYVLPAASWLESPILWDFSGHSNFMVAGEAALPTAIPGEYEHMVDYDIYRGLAMRLGKGEYWPWPSLERYYDALLAPTGLSHQEYVYQRRCEHKPAVFKKYKAKGFATPTGKVELYSTFLEKLGFDPLPAYEEPAETPVSEPGKAKEYPFMLINGGRVRESFHSEWKQVKSVRELHLDPLMQIHPETAAKLGIRGGGLGVD